MLRAAPAWATNALDRVESAAGAVTTVTNWPVDDAAAVIGVETAWLAGLLLAVKIVTAGFVWEFRRHESKR
jgi:hypothetical protein